MQPWRESVRLGALRKQLPTIPTRPRCSSWAAPVLHQALGRQEFTMAEAVPAVCPHIFPKLRQNRKNPDNSQFSDHLLNCPKAVARKGFSPSTQEQSHWGTGMLSYQWEVQSFCSKLRCSDDSWACWNLGFCTSSKASKTHSCIFIAEEYEGTVRQGLFCEVLKCPWEKPSHLHCLHCWESQ